MLASFLVRKTRHHHVTSFLSFHEKIGIYHDHEQKRIAITSAPTVQKNLTERTQTNQKHIAITSVRTVQKNLAERTQTKAKSAQHH